MVLEVFSQDGKLIEFEDDQGTNPSVKCIHWSKAVGHWDDVLRTLVASHSRLMVIILHLGWIMQRARYRK